MEQAGADGLRAVPEVLILLPLAWLASMPSPTRRVTSRCGISPCWSPIRISSIRWSPPPSSPPPPASSAARRRADGLAGGAHRHAVAAHARAGHRLVRDAAVSRRDRLGVAGGAEQRPAQPGVSRLTGAPSDEHLFNIYSLTGLIFVISCYTFPYVFVLVANALDRIPGELEDASAILGGGPG